MTCLVLALLLRGKGLDLRRIIVYAWCPLPIVEFAVQGHVDVVTITCMVLAVLCASSTKPPMRTLAGCLIGLATLTKIYPILLLIVLLRRKDYALFISCMITIFSGYLPFFIIGHGQVLGFLLVYAGEQTKDAGVVQQLISWISIRPGYSIPTTLALERSIDVVIVGIALLVVLLLRLHKRITVEAAMILLVGITLAISPHIFSWYTTALLPWVAVLVGPLWTNRRLNGQKMAVATVWYFSCVSILSYLFASRQDWSIYYALVYGVPLAVLGLAAAASIDRVLDQRLTFR